MNLNQLKGAICIKVTGKNVERFVRKIINLKIEILDLKIVKYNEAIIKIYKSDLEKIEKIKTIYEIEVIGLFGIEKIKKILKMNRYLIIGLLFGYLLLKLLTNVVFEIEVVHNDKDIRKLLKNELEEYGIKEKHFKKSYKQIQMIKRKILNKYKDKIEWIEIEEQGTKYIVRVEERIITKVKKEPSKQNVIAKKSAILKKIDASSGEIVKEINDYVRKGDIVITGNIKLNDETKSIVGASGRIYGEVWYKTTVEYPLHYKEEILLNKKKTIYAIQFLNHYFSLELKPFKTKKIKHKTILKNNLIPIKLVKQNQTKTKLIDEKYSKNEAIKKAINKAKMKIKSKLNDNEYIIDYKQLNINENDSKIIVEVFFSVCEDITDTEEIKEENIKQEIES